MQKAEKNISLITGIITFSYFTIPIIADGLHWKSDNEYVYDFLFLATYPYDTLCNMFQRFHFFRYVGQFIVFLIIWWLLFLLCRTIYEMLNEIYLDRKRFRGDRDDMDD
ncbi:MAG TPA: hypothetical protein VNZ45_10575 [Bacteroidia bacterium]|jgi:hypothetical protein|nr:hypothetical protein [Bacteroidia bacterium]